MNDDQFSKLTSLLGQIIERLPEPAAKPVPPRALKGSELSQAKRLALIAMLDTLDGWIEGAKENHDAMGHSHENRGEECWRQYTPSDIRRMVNDAAREVGVSEFPILTGAVEDAG